LDCSTEEACQAPRGAWTVRPQEGTQTQRVPTWFFLIVIAVFENLLMTIIIFLVAII